MVLLTLEHIVEFAQVEAVQLQVAVIVEVKLVGVVDVVYSE